MDCLPKSYAPLTDGRSLNESMFEKSPAPNRELSHLKLKMKQNRQKDLIERKVKSHLDHQRYP